MPKEMTREQRYTVGALHLLVGKTVTGYRVDRDGTGGLQFTDGTMAWILADPEGNGPGHIEVVQPQKEKGE